VKLLQEINIEYCRLQLFENDLVRIEIKGNFNIGAAESEKITDILGSLANGKKMRVLMVADEITQFDKSAREYSAGEAGSRYTLADALVVKNLAQKIMANFYVSVNKPKVPSKTFNSEEEAKKWLLGLK